MPTSSDTDICKTSKRCDYFYVHIEYLPWDACHSDVRKFFNESEIIDGGVLIHGHHAFIAFKDRDAAEDAVEGSDTMFRGRPVHMSVTDKDGMEHILLRNTRRKLKFEKRVSQDNGSMLSFVLAPKKKIRPTPVKVTRTAVSCSSFLPEEIEYTAVPCRKAKRSMSCGRIQLRKLCNGIKKIHPTCMGKEDEWNKLSVFHPEKCYEMQDISGF